MSEQSSSVEQPCSLTVSKDTTDSVVFSIVSKFVERSKFGKQKYGTDLDRTDLSVLDWIQHAQEEHMDAILYLEKLKKTILEEKNGKYPHSVSHITA